MAEEGFKRKLTAILSADVVGTTINFFLLRSRKASSYQLFFSLPDSLYNP